MISPGNYTCEIDFLEFFFFSFFFFFEKFTSLKIDGVVVCLSFAVNIARFNNVVITITRGSQEPVSFTWLYKEPIGPM